MRVRQRGVAGWLLALMGLWTHTSWAGVLPELPANQTAQVFSPFFFHVRDNGENVIFFEGPKVRGYQPEAYLTTSEPVLGQKKNADFNKFLHLLRTEAGILFINSHGATEAVAVEAFPRGIDGEAEANREMKKYVASGDIGSHEIYLDQVSGSENWAIFVEASFIRRTIAKHSIVFMAVCYSASFESAFISAAHKVRNFIGFEGLLLYGELTPNGRTISRLVFNTMAGTADVNGFFSNQPISAVVPLAQKKYPNTVWKTDTPDAGQMRLYLAPRITEADVLQDADMDGSFESSIFRFHHEPGSDFPGALPELKFAKYGPLSIRLKFSHEMDSRWTPFAVELRHEGGTVQNIPGTWSSPANTAWSGIAALPLDATDGNAVVAVRARTVLRGPGQDNNNQELDTSGSGSAVPPSWDTRISFRIARTPPAIKVWNSEGGSQRRGHPGSAHPRQSYADRGAAS